MHVPDAHVGVVVPLIGSKTVHFVIEAQIDSTSFVKHGRGHKCVIQRSVELVQARRASNFNGSQRTLPNVLQAHG